MSFFFVQSPVIVIGALGIDGDTHICAVLHQIVSCLSVDLNAVYITVLSDKGLQKFDPFIELFDIPSGFCAGLGQDLRVVCIDSKDILGDLFLRYRLNNIFDTFCLILVRKKNGQPLSCRKVDLFDLLCERIAAMDQYSTADSVQGLTFIQ